jgi:hypothetical protein
MYLHKQTSADEMINIKGGTVVELVTPLDPIKLTVPSFKTCENQLYEIKPIRQEIIEATSLDFKIYLNDI